MQLPVDERDQPLEGFLLALSPFEKQPGDGRRLVADGTILSLIRGVPGPASTSRSPGRTPRTGRKPQDVGSRSVRSAATLTAASAVSRRSGGHAMSVRSRPRPTILSRLPAIVLVLLAVRTRRLRRLGSLGARVPVPAVGSVDPRPKLGADGVHRPRHGVLSDHGPARRPGADRAAQLDRRAHLDRRRHAAPGIPGHPPSADGRLIFIEGKICPEACAFEVRFGTRDGERRAYLTVDYVHWNPGTLVDVEVAGGALVVTETDEYPPGAPRCRARSAR